MPWARLAARQWHRWGIVAGVALTSCIPAVAIAQEAAWDDATVIRAGGGTFLLDSAVYDALSDAPAMRTSMQRIGLKQACAISAVARRQAVAIEADAFLPVLLTTMRARIPAERLTDRSIPSFLSASLGIYKADVAAALERDAAPIYARAKAAALAQFESEVAAAPATSTDWSGIFHDWNLDSALSVRTACSSLSSSDPAASKRAFDIFYQRKENR